MIFPELIKVSTETIHGFWSIIFDSRKMIIMKLKRALRFRSDHPDIPGGVCIEAEFDRRARRERSLIGDFGSGGLRSSIILDMVADSEFV